MMQAKLLRWFERNQRPLPWRRHYRPYEVWISEIMLQQTQMETVLPYYRGWMKAFPTVEALAASSEEKVLKIWQGLGYYSRARNLHETARRIVREFGGKFPSDSKTIRSLKGVGPYTAGAIASIAFNLPAPIVDGNIVRVLSRVFAISDPFDTAAGRERFWKLEESLIPKNRARDFNQALMELGALVCAPQNPRCGDCPLKTHCRAFQTARIDEFPVKKERKKTVKVTAGALLWSRGGAFYLHRRPTGAIMGGLWEFPEWKIARDAKLGEKEISNKLRKMAESEFKTQWPALEPVHQIRRNYTHHLESLHVFHADGGQAARDGRGWESAWVTPEEFKRYPFTSAHAKIAELAGAVLVSASSSRRNQKA